ncbi:hypothetical protein DPEC_G00170010 [Dallia pectoralis]|uniref:Uncharacterized protein n=1 Tax=Dallia pectoralis TaxID=75939 RepID=A0ACC2GD01_DALPE|nr:hypothetical protein DPEC_G00170010 [Dallia pectoralis]
MRGQENPQTGAIRQTQVTQSGAAENTRASSPARVTVAVSRVELQCQRPPQILAELAGMFLMTSPVKNAHAGRQAFTSSHRARRQYRTPSPRQPGCRWTMTVGRC